jgi:hypothetical protein
MSTMVGLLVGVFLSVLGVPLAWVYVRPSNLSTQSFCYKQFNSTTCQKSYY